MLGKLTNEEEQCIDDILTSGLNEINDVPSLALSSMSNLSTPCHSQPTNLNLSKNHKNNSLRKDSLNNSNNSNNKFLEENKSNSSISLHLSSSINEKENININKEDNNDDNNNKNKEIKNNININNNKNSNWFSDENILNIINLTEATSTKKAETELSNSTQKLIDKYISIDLNSDFKEIKNLKNSNNNIDIVDNNILSPSFVNLKNNISNIDNMQKTHNEDEILNGENSIIKINNLLLEKNEKEKLSLIDLSEKNNLNNNGNYNVIKHETNIVNLNENKKNKIGNDKYNPKSAALKKLIDKIKKDEASNNNSNNYDSNDENENNNSIKYNLMPNGENSINTELFTLGNDTTGNINYLKKDNNKLNKIFRSKRKKKEI